MAHWLARVIVPSALLLCPAPAAADWVRQSAGLGDKQGFLGLSAVSSTFAVAVGVTKQEVATEQSEEMRSDARQW